MRNASPWGSHCCENKWQARAKISKLWANYFSLADFQKDIKTKVDQILTKMRVLAGFHQWKSIFRIHDTKGGGALWLDLFTCPGVRKAFFNRNDKIVFHCTPTSNASSGRKMFVHGCWQDKVGWISFVVPRNNMHMDRRWRHFRSKENTENNVFHQSKIYTVHCSQSIHMVLWG